MLTDPLYSDAEIEALSVRVVPSHPQLRGAVADALREMRLRYEADRVALVAALQDEIGRADSRVDAARETAATVTRALEAELRATRGWARTLCADAGHDDPEEIEDETGPVCSLCGYDREADPGLRDADHSAPIPVVQDDALRLLAGAAR